MIVTFEIDDAIGKKWEDLADTPISEFVPRFLSCILSLAASDPDGVIKYFKGAESANPDMYQKIRKSLNKRGG